MLDFVETIANKLQVDGYSIITEPPLHISISQARVWNQCQVKWFFQYMTDVPNIMPDRVALGILAHNVYADKAKSLCGMLKEYNQELSIENAFAELKTEKYTLDEYGDWDKVKAQTNKIVSRSLGMFNDLPKPAMVEYALSGMYINNIPLEGYVDLIGVDGSIIDYKTTGRHKSQADVDEDLQLTLYSWAFGGAPLVKFVSIRSDTGEYKILESTRTSQQCQALVDMLEQTYESMDILKSKLIMSANTEGWHCGKGCGFRKYCPYACLKGGNNG